MTPAPPHFLRDAFGILHPNVAFMNWAYEALGLPHLVVAGTIATSEAANIIFRHCGVPEVGLCTETAPALDRIEALVLAHAEAEATCH